jgi:hydrogenase small subunit
MANKPLTIYESMQLQGYSRRDFLKFCSWMAAFIGIESSGVSGLVRAMETKPRLPVVWFHFQECTC